MATKNRRARVSVKSSMSRRRRRRSSKAERVAGLGDLPRVAGRAGSMLLGTVRAVLPDPSRWMGR